MFKRIISREVKAAIAVEGRSEPGNQLPSTIRPENPFECMHFGCNT
ncbi:MAG: hypothetical protein KBF37_07170 [Saprospiraceae bacterium]|nr:hypothetical protein [Saprospiraceae bacterium]